MADPVEPSTSGGHFGGDYSDVPETPTSFMGLRREHTTDLAPTATAATPDCTSTKRPPRGTGTASVTPELTPDATSVGGMSPLTPHGTKTRRSTEQVPPAEHPSRNQHPLRQPEPRRHEPRAAPSAQAAPAVASVDTGMAVPRGSSGEYPLPSSHPSSGQPSGGTPATSESPPVDSRSPSREEAQFARQDTAPPFSNNNSNLEAPGRPPRAGVSPTQRSNSSALEGSTPTTAIGTSVETPVRRFPVSAAAASRRKRGGLHISVPETPGDTEMNTMNTFDGTPRQWTDHTIGTTGTDRVASARNTSMTDGDIVQNTSIDLRSEPDGSERGGGSDEDTDRFWMFRKKRDKSDGAASPKKAFSPTGDALDDEEDFKSRIVRPGVRVSAVLVTTFIVSTLVIGGMWQLLEATVVHSRIFAEAIAASNSLGGAAVSWSNLVTQLNEKAAVSYTLQEAPQFADTLSPLACSVGTTRLDSFLSFPIVRQRSEDIPPAGSLTLCADLSASRATTRGWNVPRAFTLAVRNESDLDGSRRQHDATLYNPDANETSTDAVPPLEREEVTTVHVTNVRAYANDTRLIATCSKQSPCGKLESMTTTPNASLPENPSFIELLMFDEDRVRRALAEAYPLVDFFNITDSADVKPMLTEAAKLDMNLYSMRVLPDLVKDEVVFVTIMGDAVGMFSQQRNSMFMDLFGYSNAVDAPENVVQPHRMSQTVMFVEKHVPNNDSRVFEEALDYISGLSGVKRRPTARELRVVFSSALRANERIDADAEAALVAQFQSECLGSRPSSPYSHMVQYPYRFYQFGIGGVNVVRRLPDANPVTPQQQWNLRVSTFGLPRITMCATVCQIAEHDVVAHVNMTSEDELNNAPNMTVAQALRSIPRACPSSTGQRMFVMANADFISQTGEVTEQYLSVFGWMSLLCNIVMHFFFYAIVAVPVRYLRSRVLCTLQGTEPRFTVPRLFVITMTRRLWIGELKSMTNAFAAMALKYEHNRRFLPEYVRRRQEQVNLNALIAEADRLETQQLTVHHATLGGHAGPTGNHDEVIGAAHAPYVEGPNMQMDQHTMLAVTRLGHRQEGDEPQPPTPEPTGFDGSQSVEFPRRRSVAQFASPNEDGEQPAVTNNSELLANQLRMMEPPSPLMPGAAHVSVPVAANRSSSMMTVESATVLVVSLGFLETAYDQAFNAAETVHHKIYATVLNCVRKHQGDLFARSSEVIGASWNAFEPAPNHAELGVECALELSQTFESLRQRGMRIGFAINSGPIVCGVVGDAYSVTNVLLGRTLTVAAQLAELSCEVRGASMLATEAVRQALSHNYDFLIVDVVGTTTDLDRGVTPLNVFDVKRGGFRSAHEDHGRRRRRHETPQQVAAQRHHDNFMVTYNTAFAFFRTHDFDAALKKLQEVQTLPVEFIDADKVARLQRLCQFYGRNNDKIRNPYVRVIPQWFPLEQVADEGLRAIQDAPSVADPLITFGGSGFDQRDPVDASMLVLRAESSIDMGRQTSATAPHPSGSFITPKAGAAPDSTTLFSVRGNYRDGEGSLKSQISAALRDRRHKRTDSASSQRAQTTSNPTSTPFSAVSAAPPDSATTLERHASQSDGAHAHSTETPPPTVAPSKAAARSRSTEPMGTSDSVPASPAKRGHLGAPKARRSGASSKDGSPKQPASPNDAPRVGDAMSLDARPVPRTRPRSDSNSEPLSPDPQSSPPQSVGPVSPPRDANPDVVAKAAAAVRAAGLTDTHDFNASFRMPRNHSTALTRWGDTGTGEHDQLQASLRDGGPNASFTGAALAPATPLTAGGGARRSNFATTSGRRPKPGESTYFDPAAGAWVPLQSGSNPVAAAAPAQRPPQTSPTDAPAQAASPQLSQQQLANVPSSTPGKPAENKLAFTLITECSLTDDSPARRPQPGDLQNTIDGFRSDNDDDGDSARDDLSHTQRRKTGDGPLPVVIAANNHSEYQRSDKMIGRGSFGSVYLGMEKHSGKLVALKFLPMPEKDDAIDKIDNEVRIMQRVRDSHVVDFYGYAVTGDQIVLVMECVIAGSLSSMLESFSQLPTVTTVNFMRDILRGLSKLHSEGIMHRDIKPQNVLVTTSGQCKITDFGASAMIAALARSDSAIEGTPLYLAPEAARGEACFKSDIWSLGIMFLQLVTGKIPYDIDMDSIDVFAFVWQIGSGHLLPAYDDAEMSDLTRQFVDACLEVDAVKRKSANELLQLPFFFV